MRNQPIKRRPPPAPEPIEFDESDDDLVTSKEAPAANDPLDFSDAAGAASANLDELVPDTAMNNDLAANVQVNDPDLAASAPAESQADAAKTPEGDDDLLAGAFDDTETGTENNAATIDPNNLPPTDDLGLDAELGDPSLASAPIEDVNLETGDAAASIDGTTGLSAPIDDVGLTPTEENQASAPPAPAVEDIALAEMPAETAAETAAEPAAETISQDLDGLALEASSDELPGELPAGLQEELKEDSALPQEDINLAADSLDTESLGASDVLLESESASPNMDDLLSVPSEEKVDEAPLAVPQQAHPGISTLNRTMIALALKNGPDAVQKALEGLGKSGFYQGIVRVNTNGEQQFWAWTVEENKVMVIPQWPDSISKNFLEDAFNRQSTGWFNVKKDARAVDLEGTGDWSGELMAIRSDVNGKCLDFLASCSPETAEHQGFMTTARDLIGAMNHKV